MRIVSVIGAGRIAMPVVALLSAEPGWRLGAVLSRGRGNSPPGALTDPEDFFRRPCDLFIEAAGPAALATHGPAALARADLWTVSASALADPAVAERLTTAAEASGRRLRLLSGAIAGLDGVAAAAIAGGDRLHVECLTPGLPAAATPAFDGPLRDGARAFPHEVNVAVAAALAGPGIAATTLRLTGTGPGGEHRLTLTAPSEFGTMRADVMLRPLAPGRMHPVSASIIAALRRWAAPVQAG